MPEMSAAWKSRQQNSENNDSFGSDSAVSADKRKMLIGRIGPGPTGLCLHQHEKYRAKLCVKSAP